MIDILGREESQGRYEIEHYVWNIIIKNKRN